MAADALMTDSCVRRELRAGDADAIVDLHERVYAAEYGMDERFWAAVGCTVQVALAKGWPASGGGAWLIDRGGELCGSLGLTHEGSGVGQVRWFVFTPELRGHGLGRSLLAELLAQARSAGLRRLKLDTFSALTAAAHLYRETGFRLVSERETEMWGPPIVYQHYELELRS